MRIYIAGPMTGMPQDNYPAFMAAAEAWRDMGWDVENPAEHFDRQRGRPYRTYVDVDVKSLKTCDAIAMLPDWDAGHSGAIWEHAIATQLLGIPVFDATKPCGPCCQLGGEGDGETIILSTWQRDVLPPEVGRFIDEVLSPAVFSRFAFNADGTFADGEDPCPEGECDD